MISLSMISNPLLLPHFIPSPTLGSRCLDFLLHLRNVKVKRMSKSTKVQKLTVAEVGFARGSTGGVEMAIPQRAALPGGGSRVSTPTQPQDWVRHEDPRLQSGLKP